MGESSVGLADRQRLVRQTKLKPARHVIHTTLKPSLCAVGCHQQRSHKRKTKSDVYCEQQFTENIHFMLKPEVELEANAKGEIMKKLQFLSALANSQCNPPNMYFAVIF